MIHSLRSPKSSRLISPSGNVPSSRASTRHMAANSRYSGLRISTSVGDQITSGARAPAALNIWRTRLGAAGAKRSAIRLITARLESRCAIFVPVRWFSCPASDLPARRSDCKDQRIQRRSLLMRTRMDCSLMGRLFLIKKRAYLRHEALLDHPAVWLIGFEGAFGFVSASGPRRRPIVRRLYVHKKWQGVPVQCHLAVEAIRCRAGTTATQG